MSAIKSENDLQDAADKHMTIKSKQHITFF